MVGVSTEGGPPAGDAACSHRPCHAALYIQNGRAPEPCGHSGGNHTNSLATKQQHYFGRNKSLRFELAERANQTGYMAFHGML